LRKSDLKESNIGTVVDNLSKQGLAPKQIINAIMIENPTLTFNDKDIYNLRLYQRQAQLNGLTPIEALIKHLEENSDSFIGRVFVEGEHLKALLFATHKQIAFHHAYPDILLLDCTYKTNRYGMPLLHFGAPTPCNTYFSTAFYFLSGEAEDDYKWALKMFNELVLDGIKQPNVVVTDNYKALKNTLTTTMPTVPQLQCRFHINENVNFQFRQAYKVGTFMPGSEGAEAAKLAYNTIKMLWTEVVDAHTVDDHNQKWTAFIDAYEAQHPTVIIYLRNTYLIHKHEFCKAWIRISTTTEYVQHRHWRAFTALSNPGSRSPLSI
jgi:MULE transposase domain